MRRQTETVKDIFKDKWNEGDRDLCNHRQKIWKTGNEKRQLSPIWQLYYVNKECKKEISTVNTKRKNTSHHNSQCIFYTIYMFYYNLFLIPLWFINCSNCPVWFIYLLFEIHVMTHFTNPNCHHFPTLSRIFGIN